ncbi:MAG: DUF5688 family protein [Clostridium sp.]|nr:DUF5688 family protein [Acetatifactor muris]MCM1526353.1 DUF5688 family protein [Bacteroides sp.]MCM1563985.1 DUF5688 family protein [Clostridium sp.]
MSYTDFKRELFASVLLREETAHKRVRILEDGDGGESGEVLCISWTQGDKTCVFHWYIWSLYKRFLGEGWKSILTEIAYQVRLCSFLPGEVGTHPGPAMLRQAALCDRVIMRPLNYERNREELRDSVYWRFGEIALVLHVPLRESGEEHMTMKLSRRTAQQWNVSSGILLMNAILTTCRDMPPRLYGGGDLSRFACTDRGRFMPGESRGPEEPRFENGEEGRQGYRLTNVGRTNGAIALFYPGVQERLAVLLRGDYYVGFINAHEAVVHPVRYKVLGEMKAAVLRANVLCDRREMLTSRVYRYCSAQKRLVEV